MSHDLQTAAEKPEDLLGPPPSPGEPGKKPSGKDLREQAERSRRFRALPPRLQEGLLRYGEQLQKAYLTKFR